MHRFYSIAWEGASLFWKRMTEEKKVNGKSNWQIKKKNTK